MDIQILATVSTGFQILGVLWVLFFGSRTLFEALKAKKVSPHVIPPSNPSSNYRDPTTYRRATSKDPASPPISSTPGIPPVKRRGQPGNPPIPPEESISRAIGSSGISVASHYQTWQWTGVFILLAASIAWVAFKANVAQTGLVWYEVLIIGLIPSAILITRDNASPPLTVGYLCLGPLIAVAIHFLLYPFHLPILLSALAVFIAPLVFLFGYRYIVDISTESETKHKSSSNNLLQ